MIKLGLTGLIACGKSTVSKMLEELGATLIDADLVGHEIMLPGTEAYQKIVERFGTGILADDGKIDRTKLGPIVFKDPQALKDLDGITHPAVRARTRQLIAEAKTEVVVIEAIKLIEAGMSQYYDTIWIVICNPEQQVVRLMATRNMTEDQARIRLEAQGSIDWKLKLAQVIIDNSGTLDETREQVKRGWERTLARGAKTVDP